MFVDTVSVKIMSLAELRKKLRAAVRGEWSKPEMIAAQDALSKAAAEAGISGPDGHFAKCAREARPITECYAEKGKDLHSKYKAVWGRPS